MSWDPAWERVFTARPWGRYPPEELVRFAAREVEPGARVLELGCGPGANVWYLAREGFAATGLDGSAAAIEQARQRLASDALDARLVAADFTRGLAGELAGETFDAVVDVAALQHNRLGAARRCVVDAAELVRPGGRLFSMLVARGSWGDGLGREVEPQTFDEIPEGPLAGTGLCRFYALEELEELFAPFSQLAIEYSERSLDRRRHVYRHWVVTGTRRT